MTSAETTVPRIDVMGIRVSSITMDDAVLTIERWIAERERNYICVSGVHGLMESRKDEKLRDIHNAAGMVTPDGMPLVWMSRILGSRRTERVYGPDLMRRMTAVSAERGYRQFYYGGGPGLAEKLRDTLTAHHPGLRVVGTICPPFRALTPEEDDAIVAEINAARPDIVWVGLSTPKQEYWMSSHLGRIEAPVMVGVGAAFDFLAGTKVQAPRFMQRNGLEWLFRMTTEPKRLGKRYAYIVPTFAMLATAHLMRRAGRSLLGASPDGGMRKSPIKEGG